MIRMADQNGQFYLKKIHLYWKGNKILYHSRPQVLVCFFLGGGLYKKICISLLLKMIILDVIQGRRTHKISIFLVVEPLSFDRTPPPCLIQWLIFFSFHFSFDESVFLESGSEGFNPLSHLSGPTTKKTLILCVCLPLDDGQIDYREFIALGSHTPMKLR